MNKSREETIVGYFFRNVGGPVTRRTAIKRIKLQEKRTRHVAEQTIASIIVINPRQPLRPLSRIKRNPSLISRISIPNGPGLLSILRCSINFRIDAARLRLPRYTSTRIFIPPPGNIARGSEESVQRWIPWNLYTLILRIDITSWKEGMERRSWITRYVLSESLIIYM